MNALLTADKRENIEATGENIKPMFGLPYDPKATVVKLVAPYKELDHSFLSKQRRMAVTALKRDRNFRTLLEVAEGYFIKGVFPEAQSYYKQALEVNPQLFIAYQRLKLIALKKKDLLSLEDNQRLLVESSQRRSDFLHEYVLMRIALHPKDKLIIEQSLSDLEEAMEKEPNNASYLSSRGFILLNFFQDTKRAESDFRNALAINPENIDANNNLGVILMRRNDFQNAIIQFEACIRISPKYQFSYQNLCFCHRSTGEFHDALTVLKRASDAGVVLPKAWQHLYGWLLIRTGELVAAQEWYANRILQEPDNNLLYNNLGVCFLESNNVEVAILNFEKAIHIVKNKIKQRVPLDPRDLHAFCNRGRVALDGGDQQKTKEIYTELIGIDPDNVYALYLQGHDNLVKGKIREALNIYSKCIKSDPLLPDPYPDAAFILECHIQDYRMTIDLLEAALGRGIKTHLVLNNLAYAYIKAGELDKADKIIQSCATGQRAELLATKGLLSFHRMNLKEGDQFYALAIEKLKDRDKPMATQLWHYERALYFYRKEDYKNALLEAKLAKQVKNSYLDKNIQELMDKLAV